MIFDWGDMVLKAGDVHGEGGSKVPLFLLVILLWASQEMAFPMMSWCSKAVLHSCMKSSKVPTEIVALVMAFCLKVAAHVWATPLVM